VLAKSANDALLSAAYSVYDMVSMPTTQAVVYSHSMYLSAICVELVVDNGLYSLPYLPSHTQESSPMG